MLGIARRFMRIEKILPIQVDGIQCQPPKGVRDAFCKEVGEATYKTIHNSLRVDLRKYTTAPRQTDTISDHLIYKVKEVDHAGYPGGILTVAEDTEPPAHKDMGWTSGGKDTIPPHVASGMSCCVLGPPGTGKSVKLKKIEETLVEQGLQVQKLSLSHAAARNIEGETTHSFVARHVMHGTC